MELDSNIYNNFMYDNFNVRGLKRLLRVLIIVFFILMITLLITL